MQKQVRKLTLWLLIATFVLSQMFVSVGAYSDVQDGQWFAKGANNWGHLLADGDTFDPYKPVSRAEFAYILNSVLGFPAAASTFPDTASSDYKDDIGAFQKAGIVVGDDNGAFNPDSTMTRAMFARWVGLAFGLLEAEKVPTFGDIAAIPDWAKGFLFSLQEGKYMIGNESGNFDPDAILNRAMIFTLVDIAASKYADKKGSDSFGEVKGNVIINTPDFTLNDTIVRGNIIIAPGVGNGDVTLNNVHMEGSLIVRGGGKNSIHITGTSKIQQLVIDKVSGDSVRIDVAEGASLTVVVITGDVGVILDGAVGVVVIESAVTVTVEGDVEHLIIQVAAAEVVIEADATVETLDVPGIAANASVENKGTITELNVQAATAEVNNSGTIEEAAVAITVTGTAPASVTEVEAGSINDVYVK